MKVESGTIRTTTYAPSEPVAPPKPPPPPPAPLKVKDGFDTQGAVAPSSARLQAQVAAERSGAADAAGGAIAAAAGAVTTPPAVPDAALQSLSPEDQAKVKGAADGTQGPAAQTNLNSVVNAEGFKSLSAAQQGEVLKSYLAGPPTSASSTAQLTSLVNSASFKGLSAADQKQTLEVFNATDTTGRERLVTLTNRQLNGQSALLDKDKDGNTLLSNLHAMATQPLAEDFANNGVTRESLLSTVMQEAGTPGEINQHSKNTCTVTSMQYILNQTNPGEYLRIMKGLTSPEGSVQLRGGQTIRRESDAVAPDTATQRSATERIFQSAMMEYSNGDHEYNNGTDRSTGNDKILGIFDNKKDYEGLYSDQEERGMEALFGRGYDVYSGSFNFHDDKDDIVNALTERNGQPTMVDLSWGSGGHAVVVEKVEDGRVYFRNPWGPTNDAKGTEYGDPPRRLEDGATRVESMSVEDFKKHVRDAYLPN